MAHQVRSNPHQAQGLERANDNNLMGASAPIFFLQTFIYIIVYFYLYGDVTMIPKWKQEGLDTENLKVGDWTFVPDYKGSFAWQYKDSTIYLVAEPYSSGEPTMLITLVSDSLTKKVISLELPPEKDFTFSTYRRLMSPIFPMAWKEAYNAHHGLAAASKEDAEDTIGSQGKYEVGIGFSTPYREYVPTLPEVESTLTMFYNDFIKDRTKDQPPIELWVLNSAGKDITGESPISEILSTIREESEHPYGIEDQALPRGTIFVEFPPEDETGDFDMGSEEYEIEIGSTPYRQYAATPSELKATLRTLYDDLIKDRTKELPPLDIRVRNSAGKDITGEPPISEILSTIWGEAEKFFEDIVEEDVADYVKVIDESDNHEVKHWSLKESLLKPNDRTINPEPHKIRTDAQGRSIYKHLGNYLVEMEGILYNQVEGEAITPYKGWTELVDMSDLHKSGVVLHLRAALNHLIEVEDYNLRGVKRAELGIQAALEILEK